MWNLLKLAARNLLRHGRRTLITVAAISLGLGMMIMSNNINHGLHLEMVRSGVSSMAGHVVVQAPGYQEERDQDITVPDAAGVEAALREALPGTRVLSRSFLQGLVTSPVNSVGVAVTAVQPDAEAEISDWKGKLTEGEWLSDDRDIILGWRLAESLDVELGDKVVVMTQGQDDVSSRLFRVSGLMRSGSEELDGFFTLIHLDAAQELLEQPGVAHQVSVHMDDPARSLAATKTARAALADRGLDVLHWQEALPEVYELIILDDRMNGVFMGVIGIIVALGVLNTVLMSVMERIREFGVLLALGMSPRQLARMVMLEGLVLGVGATALGVAIGVGLTWPIATNGLDYAKMTGMESMDVSGVTVSTLIYAGWNVELMVIYAVASVALTTLAAIYPAWRAAGLQPVEAMRHV